MLFLAALAWQGDRVTTQRILGLLDKWFPDKSGIYLTIRYCLNLLRWTEINNQYILGRNAVQDKSKNFARQNPAELPRATPILLPFKSDRF